MKALKMHGHSGAGLFGYSHTYGGFSGGQAEYVRVTLWRRRSYKNRRSAIDPTFLITHRLKLDDAPQGYEIFAGKKDQCVKIIMTP